MTVPARISIVTLGVADLARSIAFYTGYLERRGVGTEDLREFLAVIQNYRITRAPAVPPLRARSR